MIGNVWLVVISISYYLTCVFCNVHPIEIKHKHFFDSVTGKPFFIKGVDYQPGGSSAVNEFSDPLSDASKCARDVYLFQQLGINTIRVYSVNPSLNHDKCMTMLAAAGIYLVLDVNSPLPNQHLNRYEPWTSYNNEYMKHVFGVLTAFSSYNNTLAYFAGNEIINDQLSAKVSPVYLKAVVRDMKDYIGKYSPRKIPVGYSAADDLTYRISLAKYMECYEHSPNEAVDFYGVNTYQWCGEQTFQSSGYNTLVDDYSDYTKPIFFSEYGCNEVQPRLFKEVTSIYSSQMSGVFSGGLVYEFAQEPNNYGLVDFDSEGNAHLLRDFHTFKERITKAVDPPIPKKALLENQGKSGIGGFNRGTRNKKGPKMCSSQYTNLDISNGTPRSLGIDMIAAGVRVQKGKFVTLTSSEMTSKYKIFDADGKLLADRPRIRAQQRSNNLGNEAWKNGKYPRPKKTKAF
ncbi:glycoside hydrolase family 72 protein [[Candida] arabinofermentans NRRL YB-2248]|uniref:1,3-beta-glucanosyltransferase n=1 Tax=[Candida] arabinofermentans NRRL YB-2248 TaxID=983967 RepID=A0A1E4T6S2_9ASCO|nr:glycoside hydrolase family 72 protein [[Candida] arabinofermentans NRRL YB-2248]